MKTKKIEQPSLFGAGLCMDQETKLNEVSVEVRRVVDIMRECERSLSFFAVDCGLSPGEREVLLRAAGALMRQLESFKRKGAD